MADSRHRKKVGSGKRSQVGEVRRDYESGGSSGSENPIVDAVMAAAERSGLLADKSARIGGRVSPALIRAAKAATSISSDSRLIEYALANLALEDRFAEAFEAVRGTVSPDLDLLF